MPLASATPQQPTPMPTPMDDPEVGNGIKVPQTTVPGANPLDQQALATLKTPPVTVQQGGSSGSSSTGSSIGKAAGTIGGTLIAGPIGGMVGGFLGDMFGGMFNQGGYVDTNTGVAAKGLAEGGLNTSGPTSQSYGSDQTIEPQGGNPQGNNTDPYMIGYMVGALHQRDFDGTPETLLQAAQLIKQMIGPASGERKPFTSMQNTVPNRPGPATVSPPQQGYAQGGMPANPAMQPPNPMQSQPQPQLPAAPMPAPQQGFMPNNMMPAQGSARQQPRQGGMMGRPQGYAAGGPPMLQPGQPFMGEGEVNGPGGPSDDAIPAKLSDGEYVMSAPAVAFFGVDKMDKMNEQGKQGFMQSKAQVDMNQMGAPPPGQPPGASGAPPMPSPQGGAAMPPQGMAGLMGPPPQIPMQQAKGGPAVTRSRGSGYMG